MNNIKFMDFCAGVGGWRIGLENLVSEIDKIVAEIEGDVS
jgi:site-specific DNA-cytosine methylase